MANPTEILIAKVNENKPPWIFKGKVLREAKAIKNGDSKKKIHDEQLHKHLLLLYLFGSSFRCGKGKLPLAFL